MRSQPSPYTSHDVRFWIARPAGPEQPSSTVRARRPRVVRDVRLERDPGRLRARGLRWTPQRRVLVEVLSRTDGHVTGADLVERCRELDPGTIPSTVYRTLDVLEELGVLSHSHGLDGREEFHVLPEAEHGHLYCRGCGGEWDLVG